MAPAVVHNTGVKSPGAVAPVLAQPYSAVVATAVAAIVEHCSGAHSPVAPQYVYCFERERRAVAEPPGHVDSTAIDSGRRYQPGPVMDARLAGKQRRFPDFGNGYRRGAPLSSDSK